MTNHESHAYDWRKGGERAQEHKPRKQARKPAPPKAATAKPAGELTATKRKSLAESTFGLPSERKYPMPDRPHAANAKLSSAQKAKIDAKANRVLGE
jgi:hypothetical protein